MSNLATIQRSKIVAAKAQAVGTACTKRLEASFAVEVAQRPPMREGRGYDPTLQILATGEMVRTSSSLRYTSLVNAQADSGGTWTLYPSGVLPYRLNLACTGLHFDVYSSCLEESYNIPITSRWRYTV